MYWNLLPEHLLDDELVQPSTTHKLSAERLLQQVDRH